MDLTALTTSFLAVFACAAVVGCGRVSPHHQTDIKFLASNPHLKKQARLIAATCDCNKQGSWKPMFKQASFSDHHFHHDSRDAIVEKLKAHGFDVGDGLDHRGPRDPTVNNHLIHLHLIPHIYVPIMHPVSYKVHEDNQEPQSNDMSTSSEEAHEPQSTPATSHEDTDTTSGGASFEDTSQSNGHGQGQGSGHGSGHGTDNGQFYTIPPEAYHVHEDHIQHYHHIFDPTNSIEDTSAFDIPKDKNHHLVLPSNRPVRHQYEVHEDSSKDNFIHPSKENFIHPSNENFIHPSKENFIHPGQFNNIPAGSNNAPQLYQPLQPLLYINKKPYLRIPVPALPKTRHHYMRKLISRQDVEKMKIMKPPSLGQKQTWSALPRPRFPQIMKLPPTIKLSSPVPPLNRYAIAHRPKVVYYVNVRKKSDRRKK